MLSKSLEKSIYELNREDKLALYEQLQEQLFQKTFTFTPFAFKKMVQEVGQNSELIDKIDAYLKRKPVVRAYFFGEFTQHDQETSLDMLLDLEQGASHFEVISIQEGLEKLLNRPVKLVSNRVALIRLPYNSKDI
jgi:predicted nucleotidyltransferase